MTSVHSPDHVVGSPPDGASPASAGALESISVASDRPNAYALVEAIEIMHHQPDVATLLSTAAHVGTTVIPADGIAIIARAQPARF